MSNASPRLVLLLAVAVLALGSARARSDEVLTAAQAADKNGQDIAMWMRVRSIGTSTGGFIDLLSESSYQHPDAFFIRISPKGQELFKEAQISDVAKHFRPAI